MYFRFNVGSWLKFTGLSMRKTIPIPIYTYATAQVARQTVQGSWSFLLEYVNSNETRQ